MPVYEWGISIWDCVSGPALGLHYTTSSSTCTAELFSDLHKHSDKSAWVCIHAPSQEMGRRVREGGVQREEEWMGVMEEREGEYEGCGGRWGRGDERREERERERWHAANGEDREKLWASRRDGLGEESASLGLCWGGMRAAAFPRVRLSSHVSVCLSPPLLSNCLLAWLALQCGCLCSESAGWRILLEWTLTVRSECLPLRRCPVHTDSAVQAACRPEWTLAAGAGRQNLNCT